MIQVQMIQKLNGYPLTDNEVNTIKVENFTLDECKNVFNVLGDVVFQNENIIELEYNDWVVLFIRLTRE